MKELIKLLTFGIAISWDAVLFIFTAVWMYGQLSGIM